MGSIWYIDLVHVDRFWTMQSVGMIPRYMIHASVVSTALCTSVVCTHTLSMLHAHVGSETPKGQRISRGYHGIMVSSQVNPLCTAHIQCVHMYTGTHVHICTPLGPTLYRHAYGYHHTIIPSKDQITSHLTDIHADSDSHDLSEHSTLQDDDFKSIIRRVEKLDWWRGICMVSAWKSHQPEAAFAPR